VALDVVEDMVRRRVKIDASTRALALDACGRKTPPPDGSSAAPNGSSAAPNGSSAAPKGSSPAPTGVEMEPAARRRMRALLKALPSSMDDAATISNLNVALCDAAKVHLSPRLQDLVLNQKALAMPPTAVAR
jgi:hypothetical protein